MRRQSCRMGFIFLLGGFTCLLVGQYCRLTAHLPNDESFIAPGQEPQVNGLQTQESNPDTKIQISQLLLQIAKLKNEIFWLRRKIRKESGEEGKTQKESGEERKTEKESGEERKTEKESGEEDKPEFEENLQGLLPEASQKDTKSSSSLQKSLDAKSFDDKDQNSSSSCWESVQKKISESELSVGVSLNNEFEIVAGSYFTATRIYSSELSLGKRVVEKPIGYRKKDLSNAVFTALHHLNKEQSIKYSLEDFVEGNYRTVPSVGTEYELSFREPKTNRSLSHKYHRVRLLRPFAPITLVNTEKQNSKKLINIVLPLSGRIVAFNGFMNKLSKLILRSDRRIFLTVVYFGNDELQDVRNIITKVSKISNFRHINLLTLNETFSRGKALQVGAMHWSKGDVLLFMCDVDIVFSTRFLERCRYNAVRGKSVYYPIVFSLYNPNLVYPLQNKAVPSELYQLKISKDTGFWRDFGYGMTCQYRSDFLNVQGFDENIVGWGLEDVLLYRKYVKSDLRVIRATDPGIFHLWHHKNCSKMLNNQQYMSCLMSKALNEASHVQLGSVALKEQKEQTLK